MSNDNLLNIYAASFRKNWELPALSEFGMGQTMTYADLARRIAALHLLFKESGIRQGDKIALMGKNSFSWVVVYMATLTYGAVVVPVLNDFNIQDAQHIINHSDSVMLFINESIFDSMEFEKIPKVKSVLSLDRRAVLAEHPVTNRVAEKFLAKLPEKMRRTYPHGFTTADIDYPEISEDKLAEINYTSGTTGFSKGVMLTLGNLGGNVRFGIRSRLHYRGSRALSFLPLAHAYGCAFDMLTPLATGTHITILGKLPTPKLLLKAFAEVKPNLILCVPLILEKIYRNKLRPILDKPAIRRSLKIPGLKTIIFRKIRSQLIEAFGGEFEEVIVGGAPLNHEVEEFLHRIKFPFTVGYGMTECGPLISYTPWRKFLIGSSGRTLPNMESKIADSNDPEHIPGEICVRGENVMQGYFKNPEATEAVLDAEGWLHTGDMGTISHDGTIFIRGRYKTMILGASGQNIYPEEIEAKLNNMPYVAESLVVERGKHLIALVYPDYEAMDRDKITNEKLPEIMEQVRTDLNKLVAPYERIDRIQLIANEFEKTPKRSIKRYLYNA
ncbi:MAG: AMP-binding protein [Duncaniella sp.]|uniref:AMP-binding protein n=1 Tax=Duncaniella sp. TaxID=2518496 RepID=UPI0023D4FFB8|nr:AMP-binding protein [Duncaniella sp.]MDE6091136.1 AMP-binding protein [Duncaniella sp.]